jgi:undecaprenyl-phosphate galactose phosphotransferase
VDFEEWMRLDSFYVRNWSIMLDFMIMIRTFSAVFTSRGAY